MIRNNDELLDIIKSDISTGIDSEYVNDMKNILKKSLIDAENKSMFIFILVKDVDKKIFELRVVNTLKVLDMPKVFDEMQKVQTSIKNTMTESLRKELFKDKND
jgi:hypothetical protein